MATTYGTCVMQVIRAEDGGLWRQLQEFGWME